MFANHSIRDNICSYSSFPFSFNFMKCVNLCCFSFSHWYLCFDFTVFAYFYKTVKAKC